MNETRYPETLQEAVLQFANEEYAHQTLCDMRWAGGKVTCPHCQSQKVGKLVVSVRHMPGKTIQYKNKVKVVQPYTLTRRVWNCKDCGKQFTVRVGTIFEDSPLGMDKWLCALWMIVNDKNGISSYEIHRELKVTQKSAWFMLQRLRLALREGNFECMSGFVEADETYVGPKADKMNNKARKGRPSGRGAVGKAIVQGLLERPKVKGKASRVKLMIVKNTQRKTLQPNVRKHVVPGSEILSDTLASYVGLEDQYVHNSVNHLVTYVKGHVHTNGMENFWCLLKRMIRGTYICPSPMHLVRYLDEQAFRFNQRKDDNQGRFLKGLSGVADRRLTYRQLIGKPLAPA